MTTMLNYSMSQAKAYFDNKVSSSLFGLLFDTHNDKSELYAAAEAFARAEGVTVGDALSSFRK